MKIDAVDRIRAYVATIRERIEAHPARQYFYDSMAGQALRNYLDDDVDGLAGMLAFNALFSLIPVLAAISLTVGIAVQNFELRDEIAQLVTDELPEAVSEPVADTVDSTIANQGSFGLIALVTLLYGGSRLYTALDRAFSVVYRCGRRGYLERKLFTFLIAPALAVALVFSTLLSATATGLLAASFGKYFDIDVNMQEYFSVYLIAFLLGFTMTLSAYAVIPVDGAGWRGSVAGAIVAGLLFVLLSQLYPLYISITGGYSAYGVAFGLVLLFMFWLYLAAQIIIIGAEICAVTSGVRTRLQSAA